MAVSRYRRGQHGAHPLSTATRRRLLAELLDRAEAGDVLASSALVLLSLRCEQAIAATASKIAGPAQA